VGPKAESGKTATSPAPQQPAAQQAPEGEMPIIPAPPAPKQPGPGEDSATTPVTKEATVGKVGPKPPGLFPDEKGPPAEKPKPIEVGRLVSTKEVLLCLFPQPAPESAVWSYVPGQAPLYGGDKLLALPAFRPVIGLGGQVNVQMIDGTSVQILTPDAERVPGLAISFGRIKLYAQEAAGTRLRLRLGERTVLVSLQSPDSTLALDARRLVLPGVDPETQPGPVIADLYATAGKIGWQEDPAQPPVTLDPPIRRTWGPQLGAAEVSQEFPNWIFKDTTSVLDQKGALVLEKQLSTGRPAKLVLRELVDYRLREVRSLTVRSLTYLGDFEPLVRTLDDPDQKLYWDDCVAQLRAGVTRDPVSAAAVRSTMERFYGPQGASLYEMLWKFGPALSNADARQLTEYLDHQTLPFRILAFWNLKNIYSGSKMEMTLNYHPEYPSVKRQVAIQAWKERLKTPPVPRESTAKRGAKAAPKEPPAEPVPPQEAQTP
jgi:hypothetical protein